MNEKSELKQYDFVKYLKNIYLIKSFQNLENRDYRLNYYFRTIRKENAKLHFNEFDRISSYMSPKIKKASLEEINFIVSKIKKDYPNFDLSFLKTDIKENTPILNIENCIEFLKSNGYLVFKQV